MQIIYLYGELSYVIFPYIIYSRRSTSTSHTVTHTTLCVLCSALSRAVGKASVSDRLYMILFLFPSEKFKPHILNEIEEQMKFVFS